MVVTIKHPFGETKFVEKLGKYRLLDVFPNYGSIDGHTTAKQYAKYSKRSLKYVKVVPKVNATGVYGYGLRE